MTLHSALLLGRSKYSGFQTLSHDILNTSQAKLSCLMLLIVEYTVLFVQLCRLRSTTDNVSVFRVPTDTSMGYHNTQSTRPIIRGHERPSVAFSHVKILEGLHIPNFNSKRVLRYRE